MSYLGLFRLTDGLLIAVLLIGVAAEILIREIFHQVGSDSPDLAKFVLLSFLLICTFLACWRFLAGDVERKAKRLIVLASSGLTAIFVFPQLGTALSDLSTNSISLVALMTVMLGGALTLTITVSDVLWRKFRLVALVTLVTFLGSQPILVAAFAPHLYWPPNKANQEHFQEGSKGRTLTMFLLLDELNAQAAAPIVRILRAQGLQVSAKSIDPVANATAKVIPSLFTGKDFGDAKPCSTTATCSGSNILDFSLITASRADIDIVGFFHPYCVIKGLRSCSVTKASQDGFDLDRWRCRVWRRTGYPRDMNSQQCGHILRKDWAAMTNKVIQDMWSAPVWKEGGFLFAHLPLPHPPGSTDVAPLQTNYSENLSRSYSLVRDIALKIQQGRFDSVRLVIFSDHPLRQSMWCKQLLYSAHGCAPSQEFEDDKVPLIIAGDNLANIDDIVKNDQVFELSSR